MTEQATILVVDDSSSSLFKLRSLLEEWNYNVVGAGDGAAALAVLESNCVDLVLSDQMMPGMDGLELLQRAKALRDEIPFIMITAHSTVEDAVASIKQGAYDYIRKPYDPDDLKFTVSRALRQQRLSEENAKLKNQLRDRHSFQNIVTRSPRMIEALKLAEKVAQSANTTVSICGESGTGKEVLARAIHFAGEGMENRFVAVNCAGIPSTLLDSELFGHVKGAFTGADREREGKFDLAQRGTILLDEIGDMPLEIQAKLLRVLQERMYEKLGSNKAVKADFRVITATHRDLGKLVKAGQFREDLYHRINIFPIAVPALRERKEDIPLLVEHFLDQFRNELGKALPGVSRAAMEIISEYSWPGNIREMKNCLERAAIITEGELIGPQHLNICKSDGAAGISDPKDGNIRMEVVLPPEEFSLDAAVDRILQLTLERCGNNKKKAAELLKVGRSLLYRRK